ncbi:hypothetical protein D3C76_1186440 [compost metagenome]
MATHLFHLPGQALGQLRQRLLSVDVHRQRQHVQHRPGSGERRGAHPAHKDKPGGIVHASGQTGEPQGHQRQSEVGALDLAGTGELAEGVTIGGKLQAQNVGGRGATRQRCAGERYRRRELLTLPGPESTVADIRLAVAVALILLHYLGKGRKRRRRRGVAVRPGAINGGDLTGNSREAEAIHH